MPFPMGSVTIKIPKDNEVAEYQVLLVYTVADTGGLQWFQLKPPLKIVRAPDLFTIHVSDKITNSYAWCITLVPFLLAKLHTFAFENTKMALLHLPVLGTSKSNYRFN